MADVVLVINTGSSSIKFSAFEMASETLVLRGSMDAMSNAPVFQAKSGSGEVLETRDWGAGNALAHEAAIAFIADFLRSHGSGHRLAAVGHRVVHGGMDFSGPVRVDGAVLRALEALCPLAPLHQPHNLKPIRALLEQRPELPQVACFDTAYHRTQPGLAQAFALPADIVERGVRRYGFHGLSYEYIASALPGLDPIAAKGRTVVAHLGNGSSMCAMLAGKSVASTMGFTAVDGLPMGTRCGSLDPGVILYLIDQLGMDTRAVQDLIYKRSGLLGVSGMTGDMRALLDSDAPGARLAVDLYCYRIARELGSLAAALQGIDALVFTAGIGEHAPAIRDRVCRHGAWLGIRLDPRANDGGGPRIGATDSAVAVWAIPTNEELMIARHTRALLEARASAA